jgi:hypothetical protein
MPIYVVERNVDLSTLTRDDLNDIVKNGLKVANEMGNIRWVKSYVSESEGKIYCEFDAPNPDLIREHARLSGLPADRVSLVSLELDPAMFV